MVQQFPFAPPAPTISGEILSVSMYLQSPTLLRKVLEDFTTPQFVSPYLFRRGNANGGVVIYDTATGQDLYVDSDVNLQPGEIVPGSEFPMVGITDLAPGIAVVKHYGGQFYVSYTQKRRDNRDVIARGLMRLGNTLVRQSDSRAIAAIVAHPLIPRVPAAAVWTGGSEKAEMDVRTAIGAVDNSDLGYNSDTAIINPATAVTLGGLASIKALLPRENLSKNPILNKNVSGLLGLDWISSRRQPVGEVTILQRAAIGVIGEEIPPYTRIVDKPEVETYIVQAARLDVPVITDPYAAYTITGVV